MDTALEWKEYPNDSEEAVYQKYYYINNENETYSIENPFFLLIPQSKINIELKGIRIKYKDTPYWPLGEAYEIGGSTKIYKLEDSLLGGGEFLKGTSRNVPLILLVDSVDIDGSPLFNEPIEVLLDLSPPD